LENGVTTFPTHDAMPPGDLARLVESRGHRSLFFSEHTHMPASRETPFPGGEPLARKYWNTYDVFIALTAAAMATTSLRVGSGICLIAQRDPITTAKEVASIDHLSGGRFELGVGAGWNREEMRNHGTDPGTRFALMAERVDAMKAIWTQDVASYAGEHVAFDRIWSWPKPAQRPHPPVLVGGIGPTVLDRVLAFGDGWMPFPFDGMLDRVAELRRRAADIGRTVTVCVASAPLDPARLETYLETGIDRVVFDLPAAGRGPVERALDEVETAFAQATGT
jgi:probable F420-dependent oxidoreductase